MKRGGSGRPVFFLSITAAQVYVENEYMRWAFLIVMVMAASSCDDPFKSPTAPETSMTHTNNQIDYVEFAAEDLNLVKAFYAAAFGWEFQDWGDAYASFSSAGLEGGFRGGEKPVPGGPLVILYAEDLEASEKHVVAAGGEITERHEFPGGKRFHFRDPAGNMLAVWTPSETQ